MNPSISRPVPERIHISFSRWKFSSGCRLAGTEMGEKCRMEYAALVCTCERFLESHGKEMKLTVENVEDRKARPEFHWILWPDL